MKRIGHVAYACRQGLGILAKSFFDNGLITDPIIYRHSHPSRTTHAEWYPEGTPIVSGRYVSQYPDVIDEWLKRIDVALFYETPLDWSIIPKCRAAGVKTVLIPMYEWYPRHPPQQFDQFICPSLLDLDYFPERSEFIPIPVETKYWKQRTKAERFVQNGGNIGCRGHKGVKELLQAVPYIESDLKLTIRSQVSDELGKLVREAWGTRTFPNVSIEGYEHAYEDQWDWQDVLVAAERRNGCSLPLQESYAAGMVVMTTDRYPMNTWLPREPMFPFSSVERVSEGGHLEHDLVTVEPKVIAAKMDEWFSKDITEYSLAAKAWAEANSWESLKPKWVEALER